MVATSHRKHFNSARVAFARKLLKLEYNGGLLSSGGDKIKTNF